MQSVTAVAGPPVGDDSLNLVTALEYQDHPSLPAYTCERVAEVVRVGDAVLLQSTRGWETCVPERDDDRLVRDEQLALFLTWAAER